MKNSVRLAIGLLSVFSLGSCLKKSQSLLSAVCAGLSSSGVTYYDSPQECSLATQRTDCMVQVLSIAGRSQSCYYSPSSQTSSGSGGAVLSFVPSSSFPIGNVSSNQDIPIQIKNNSASVTASNCTALISPSNLNFSLASAGYFSVSPQQLQSLVVHVNYPGDSASSNFIESLSISCDQGISLSGGTLSGTFLAAGASGNSVPVLSIIPSSDVSLPATSTSYSLTLQNTGGVLAQNCSVAALNSSSSGPSSTSPAGITVSPTSLASIAAGTSGNTPLNLTISPSSSDRMFKIRVTCQVGIAYSGIITVAATTQGSGTSNTPAVAFNPTSQSITSSSGYYQTSGYYMRDGITITNSGQTTLSGCSASAVDSSGTVFANTIMTVYTANSLQPVSLGTLAPGASFIVGLKITASSNQSGKIRVTCSGGFQQDSGTFSSTTYTTGGSGGGSIGGSIGGGGGSCFVAGTRIRMEDGSLKNIEQVNVGDRVRGVTGVNTVTKVFVIPHRGLKYSINGGKAFFTASHPFLSERGWKSLEPMVSVRENPGLLVSQLSEKDILQTEQGSIRIHSIGAERSLETVYNFRTDGDHTYIADGYKVHNAQNKGTDTGTGIGQ